MLFSEPVLEVLNGRRETIRLSFIRPSDAVLLAASTVRSDRVCPVTFESDARSYAQHNGLLSVLSRTDDVPRTGGLHGVTYSRLAKLARHEEVEMCNQVIADLLWEQLRDCGPQTVPMLCRVVGELHDNVASHASGAGFSAAQVYQGREIEFAVADAGRGMLANVQRVCPQMSSDLEAIRWCLVRGNTSARSIDDPWAQRIPDDCVVSPMPGTTRVPAAEDHHMGEGLWQLQELVSLFRGELSILSGQGAVHFSQDSLSAKENSQTWNGVAVAFRISIPRNQAERRKVAGDVEGLARRLGI